MESDGNHARKRGCIMGPYSEQKQLERAEAIQGLLERTPSLDPIYRAMWKNKLQNISKSEEEYNYRVVGIYGNMTRQSIIDWGNDD